MQIVLSVTPQQLRDALRYRCTPAHVAYRIGAESCLLRGSLPLQSRGGLLSLSDWEAPEITQPERLAAAVVQECLHHGYGGAVLDFEDPPRSDRRAFVRALAERMQKIGRQLFVPEPYAVSGQEVIPLLNTALSGGSYVQYLREKRNAYPRQPALDVQRLAMDFTLPEPRGEGTPLTLEALSALMEREQPAVFFSPELCARYFTFTQGGRTHFVLFDDAGTITQKLRLAEAQGYRTAFLMYPEVRDLLPRLLPPE